MKKFGYYIIYPVALILFSCSSVKIQSITESDVQITDSIKAPFTELSELIEPFRTELEKSMNEILNRSDVVMEKPDRAAENIPPENLLGNFVAGLSFEVGQGLYSPEDGKPIDFCVLNNGGLRSSLPKGDITRGKIFELMPFENELVVLTLSGETTKKLLDYIGRWEGIPVSNISMAIQGKESKNIKIGGKYFDVSNTYKVITSDYLANGGDNMTFFSENLKTESVGIKLRDAIIKYVVEENAAGRNITSSLDKRITIIE
ncbi:MAG: 5'-nucleotidase C-terminal domain-containing protein [Flavobacteriales bacterium]|nr:5'-nucleotidase C-terminal domain-containing protein [Flavobacteriales bacterium]